MFCLQSYQGLRIHRSLVYKSYPQDRIYTEVIYRFELAQVECTFDVLLNSCKQNITSLSLLVGTTVVAIWMLAAYPSPFIYCISSYVSSTFWLSSANRLCIAASNRTKQFPTLTAIKQVLSHDIPSTPCTCIGIVCLILSFTSHQQTFSYVGTSLPELNQY